MQGSKFKFSLLSVILLVTAIALCLALGVHYFSQAETIHWTMDKTKVPPKNQYLLIACGQRTGMGYFDNGWHWEDGGGVESNVDAWAPMPHGPYDTVREDID